MRTQEDNLTDEKINAIFSSNNTMKINLDRSEEYQDLFNLLHSMGLIATVSEMDEIIRHSVIVKTKIDYKNLTQA